MDKFLFFGIITFNAGYNSKKRITEMRGYQKKVIYLKNMGSRNFEEAYFIVRHDRDEGAESSLLMIEEANKIVEENFGDGKHGRLYALRWHILAFFAGFVSGALIFFLIEIIFGIF